MAIQKSEAFVLKSLPFRTSSLLVTTFTRSFGKVKGVAKGVRKEGIPRPGTFEPFTLLEIVFYEKIRSEIHLISEASILESFNPLRSNLETLATAYYLAELVDQVTQPHDPHEAIFDLLHFAFQFLPTLSPAFMVLFFETRLLHEAGLLPHLESCLGCGEKGLEKIYFSQKHGALFCSKCRHKSPGAKALNPGALEAIRRVVSESPSEAIRQSLDPGVEKEIGNLMEGFLSDRLGGRLRSRRFLNQVRSLKLRSVKIS
ncbi:MAG: DNA repair protein RecO [Candidatus Omnitrophica bacterium]|nr:DNA repair protein RecO [Candidatus Omnitrophota bacterium]